MERLALLGGHPIWTEGWPAWPQFDSGTAERIADTLASKRWAVSGNWTGEPARDVQLAEQFAAFTGARWCVPVDHGSSALLAALHALGVGPGDEVIVPGLTWVACASVVARAGAVPVLVDVDPRTQCIDPEAVKDAIGPATAAILVVHLYSAMAEMDELSAIAARHGLPLIEDAAQAYGATWRGRGAGSLGTVGTFSAQQGKTLTSGEGGLFVTTDGLLRDKVEMLRGDGRRYTAGARLRGRPDLEERPDLQGWNMHMTELQATLLLDGLSRLPAQNLKRAAAAAALDEALSQAGDLEAIDPYRGNDKRAYYHYAIRVQDSGFAGRSAAVICEALSAELGSWIHPPYRPLNAHPLYDPRRLPAARLPGLARQLDPSRFHLPAAEREANRTILLHHSMLLGDERHIEAVLAAFGKIRRLACQLPEADREMRCLKTA